MASLRKAAAGVLRSAAARSRKAWKKGGWGEYEGRCAVGHIGDVLQSAYNLGVRRDYDDLELTADEWDGDGNRVYLDLDGNTVELETIERRNTVLRTVGDELRTIIGEQFPEFEGEAEPYDPLAFVIQWNDAEIEDAGAASGDDVAAVFEKAALRLEEMADIEDATDLGFVDVTPPDTITERDEVING